VAQHNEVLLRQLELLSTQTRRLQEESALVSDGYSLALGVGSGERASSRDGVDLRCSAENIAQFPHSVLAFMREEKRLREEELERAQQELAHCKTALARHVNDAQNLRLQLDQHKAAAVSATFEHKALVTQVNQLAILQESNDMLRTQKDKQAQLCAAAETRVSELEALLAPLESVSRQLEDVKNELQVALEGERYWRERCESLPAKANERLRKDREDADEKAREWVRQKTELLRERDELKAVLHLRVGSGGEREKTGESSTEASLANAILPKGVAFSLCAALTISCVGCAGNEADKKHQERFVGFVNKCIRGLESAGKLVTFLEESQALLTRDVKDAREARDVHERERTQLQHELAQLKRDLSLKGGAAAAAQSAHANKQALQRGGPVVARGVGAGQHNSTGNDIYLSLSGCLSMCVFMK
jgi:chromosome segregation ATPase